MERRTRARKSFLKKSIPSHKNSHIETTETEDRFCRSEAPSSATSAAAATQKRRRKEDLEHYFNCNASPFTTPEYCRQVMLEKRASSRRNDFRGSDSASDSAAVSTPESVAPLSPSSSEAFPDISSPTFYRDITAYFTTEGRCNYFVEKQVFDKSGCVFPKRISLKDINVQQRLVADYMSPQSPYRGVLCYHSLGSGKTLVCIAIMSSFLQHDRKRVLTMVVKPSLRDNFLAELDKVYSTTLFGQEITHEERRRRIADQVDVITYEELANRLTGKTGWNRQVNRSQVPGRRGYGSVPFGKVRADSDQDPMMRDTVVLIDEVQNIVTPEDAGYPSVDDANVLISALQRCKTEDGIKIVLLTATPMRDEPYEIGILMNMLKHKDDPLRFPEVFDQRPKRIGSIEISIVNKKKTREAFNSMFLHDDGGGVLVPVNQDEFLRRCKGLVSYYFNENDLSLFPKKIYETPVLVEMSMEQEKKLSAKMIENISLLTRKNLPVTCRNKTEVRMCGSARAISNSSLSMRNHIRQAIKTPRRLEDEVSPKMAKVLQVITDSYAAGKQFAYSFFSAPGVGMLTDILIHEGWERYDLDSMRKNIAQFTPYMINHGKIPPAAGLETILLHPLLPKKRFLVLGSDDGDAEYRRRLTLEFFNMASNDGGEIFNLLIADKNYSEGISLRSVRALHIVEPPSSPALYRQIVGRGARFCSHKNLPFPDGWSVRIYSYFSTWPVRDSGKSVHNPISSTALLKRDTYCDAFSGHEAVCNTKQMCTFENGKCRLLPIDMVINKMTKQMYLSGEYFLLLLQVIAFDCEVLRNVNGVASPCHRNPETEGEILLSPHPQASSSSHSRQKGCPGRTSREECRSDRSCFWEPSVFELGGRCSLRDSESLTHHSKCGLYYSLKGDCVMDPLCAWEVDRRFSNTKTHKECVDRYPRYLVDVPFGIALVTAPREDDVRVADRVLGVYPLEEVVDTDVEGRVDAILRKFKSSSSPSSPSLPSLPSLPSSSLGEVDVRHELIELLLLARVPGRGIAHRWEEIQRVLAQHQKSHEDAWRLRDILYLSFALADEASPDRDRDRAHHGDDGGGEDTPRLRKRVLLVDCHVDLMNLGVPYMEYILHLTLGGEDVFIDSRQVQQVQTVQTLPLSLSTVAIETVKEVTKIITMKGLRVYLQFYINDGVLVRIQVAYVESPSTWSSSNSTTTAVVTEQGQHAEYSPDQCQALWTKENLGLPPPRPERIPEEYRYEAVQCWARWKYGKYAIPPTWLTDADVRDKSEACLRRVEGKECEDDIECWEMATTAASASGSGASGCQDKVYPSNPFTCKRTLPKFWQKRCIRER